MVDVRSVQKPLRERYAREPEAARYTYHARVDDAGADDPMHATAVSVGHPGPSYTVTLNERIGSSGQEPTPGDLLLAALASCQAMSVKMVAASLRVRLLAIEVDVWGDVDHRGV